MDQEGMGCSERRWHRNEPGEARRCFALRAGDKMIQRAVAAFAGNRLGIVGEPQWVPCSVCGVLFPGLTASQKTEQDECVTPEAGHQATNVRSSIGLEAEKLLSGDQRSGVGAGGAGDVGEGAQQGG